MESFKYKSNNLNDQQQQQQQQENLVSSYQLASKLRKIKENLDNSYFSLPSDANLSIDEKFNSALNTSSKSANNSISTTGKFPNYENEKYSDFKKTHLFEQNSLNHSNHHHLNHVNHHHVIQPPVISHYNHSLHKPANNSNYDSLSSSQSQYFQNYKNVSNYDNNNNQNKKSSLDFILNQFEPECKKLLPIFSQNDSKSARKLANEKFLIPIYNDYNETELIFQQQQQQQKCTNETLNLVSLKQAIYTDNISRQSSIRSLISNNNIDNRLVNNSCKTSAFTRQPKLASNTSSNGILVTSDDKLNSAHKFKSQFSLSNGNLSPVYSKNEKDSEFYDWNKVNQIKSRPQTRLAYHNNNSITDLANFQLATNCSEYSDNVTIASSNSSGNKYFPDVSEECESVVLGTPTNEKNSGYARIKTINNNIKSDNETESVLSDFVSNLKFEESRNANNSFNIRNLEEYNNEFDANSEIFPDDASSYLLRKSNNNKRITHQQSSNNQMNQRFAPNFNPRTNLPSYNEAIRTTNPNEQQNARTKTYQQLSVSINDLFADLLSQLERQKNKDYNGLDNNNNNHNYREQKNLKQNHSKDSNKDSGFNQDFINKQQQQMPYFYENKTFHSPTFLSGEPSRNDVSLLERYLNNEQLVAFKHFQLVNLFQKFSKSSFNDDYGMLDYLLNQEGISRKTFKKLIKEKFAKSFEWSDELLSKVYEIINQPNDVLINHSGDVENENFDNDEEDVESTDSAQSDKKQHGKTTVSKQDSQNDSPNSPTSSSKSYRKLKDIKNSTNKKRANVLFDNKQGFNNGEEVFEVSGSNEEVEESLKKSLSNSFTRRRERKGSLPEINTSHLNAFEASNQSEMLQLQAESYLSFGHNYSGFVRAKSGADLSQMSILSKQSTNTTTTTMDKRASRRSAFVLEIMRTSMFRSKSLSDINSSLVKIEKNNSVKLLKKMDAACSLSNSETNPTNSKLDRSESLFNTSNSSSLTLNQSLLTDNYIGLIWQCADMIYEEFRNKYEELAWLMNGDNVSTSAKLKEVEQRLKIEVNLKEKNLSLLEKLNSETLLTTNKIHVQQRLESQLKIINDKIKELELMRLFLRICEINSHGLDTHELNNFFNKLSQPNNTTSTQMSFKQNEHNLLQGKSYDEILKSLYGCLNRQKDKTVLVLDRTIDLLAMWIDGFYLIDFQQNQDLIEHVSQFLENDLRLYDENKSRVLSGMLRNPNIEFNLFNGKTKSKLKYYNNELKKSENDGKKVSRILNSAIKRKLRNNIKSKSTEHISQVHDLNMSNASSFRSDSFFISDYPLDLIASQLTLIEWDNFLDIHVCQCLNSKAQGVNCDSKLPIDPNNISSQQCLFVDNYLSKSLYKMIQFNFMLTHWVSVEILMVDNSKIQVELLIKFLKIAKRCFDWNNFSTAFSIYDGLQEVTVRNLPAWQNVPGKHLHVLEKIANSKVLFQNEPMLIKQLSKSTNTPVIPCMHLFLLIVQQNERGSFQLANGQWKWSKLSYLANLVDQIRIVQQHYVCNFKPNDEFVDELLQRIYYSKNLDLNQLAETNSLDYHSQKLNSSSTIMNFITRSTKQSK